MNLPIVDVGGKRTLEYVAECLTKFNRGAKQIKVRAVGGSISKGVRVVQILQNKHKLNISHKNADIHNIKLGKYENSCIEIFVSKSESNPSPQNYDIDDFMKPSDSFENKRIITFPVYNLILDEILNKYGNLSLNWEKESRLYEVEIEKTEWGFKCKKPENIFGVKLDKYNNVNRTNSSDLPKEDETKNIKETTAKTSVKSSDPKERIPTCKSDLSEIYYRSGLLESPNWSQIAYKISEFDDLIIGFDSNILLTATFTEHFLDSLYYFDPKIYTHTPNWLLVIIPSAVMHELEQATNGRNNIGLLTQSGRMGFRALGEILEISQCIDLMGISLIIFGETDTTLDVRTEMSGLKDLFLNANKDKIRPHYLIKSSSGDTIIRDQFKRFLKQVDFFGGGAYFITADKTCAALAQTEGLNSIYYKRPHLKKLDSDISPIRIEVEDFEDIQLPVQIGKLIYESCVQFGKVNLSWKGSTGKRNSIILHCDGRGESLDHWLHRNLFVSDRDSKLLIENYKGQFPLDYVANNVWRDVRRELIKTDFE